MKKTKKNRLLKLFAASQLVTIFSFFPSATTKINAMDNSLQNLAENLYIDFKNIKQNLPLEKFNELIDNFKKEVFLSINNFFNYIDYFKKNITENKNSMITDLKKMSDHLIVKLNMLYPEQEFKKITKKFSNKIDKILISFCVDKFSEKFTKTEIKEWANSLTSNLSTIIESFKSIIDNFNLNLNDDQNLKIDQFKKKSHDTEDKPTNKNDNTSITNVILKNAKISRTKNFIDQNKNFLAFFKLYYHKIASKMFDLIRQYFFSFDDGIKHYNNLSTACLETYQQYFKTDLLLTSPTGPTSTKFYLTIFLNLLRNIYSLFEDNDFSKTKTYTGGSIDKFYDYVKNLLPFISEPLYKDIKMINNYMMNSLDKFKITHQPFPRDCCMLSCGALALYLLGFVVDHLILILPPFNGSIVVFEKLYSIMSNIKEGIRQIYAEFEEILNLKFGNISFKYCLNNAKRIYGCAKYYSFVENNDSHNENSIYCNISNLVRQFILNTEGLEETDYDPKSIEIFHFFNQKRIDLVLQKMSNALLLKFDENSKKIIIDKIIIPVLSPLKIQFNLKIPPILLKRFFEFFSQTDAKKIAIYVEQVLFHLLFKKNDNSLKKADFIKIIAEQCPDLNEKIRHINKTAELLHINNFAELTKNPVFNKYIKPHLI